MRIRRTWLLPLLILTGLLVWWLKPETSEVSVVELSRPGQADRESLSARVIGQDDLPPAGTRSLFDHLIAGNDGLPFPFDKLVQLVRDKHPDGQVPVTVLIPHGRSLLKAQANDAHPRLLVALDAEQPNTAAGMGLSGRGQLFLGFVENANEIEVLSYNEAAGRFEFQLVQNYCAGCVPRIVYARRAICTTCHQGGGPIFPQRPWNETNGQQATAQAIAQARKTTLADAYLSVALQQPLAAPERFDQLTDVGNFLTVTQRLWLDGCGADGNACRRQMLRLALAYADSPGSFETGSAEAERLRVLQRRHFPKGGIAVPESDLPNRDPRAEPRGVKGWWAALWTRDIKPGEGARDNEDLEAFDRLPRLPARLDPLTPRQPKQVLTAEDVDGVFGLAGLFSQADMSQLLVAHGQDVGRLLAHVDALPDALFAPAPAARMTFMTALLGGSRSYCCLDVSEMSPPVASGVPPLKIAKHPELKPFETHCFACHRGNPAKRLNFMAGASEDEVLASIQAKSEIREALDWARYTGTDKASKLMPPRDSVQYQRMKAAGEAGEKDRQAMHDTVPSLFGF